MPNTKQPSISRMNFAELRALSKTLLPKKTFVTSNDTLVEEGRIYIAAIPDNEKRFADSVRIASDIALQTPTLYINVTRNTTELSRMMSDVPEATEMKLEVFSLSASSLSLCFEDVKAVIEEKKIEAVVIGSFEFAAITSRHRFDLVEQILQLSKLGVSVVVFTTEQYARMRRLADTRRGPLGLLSSETKEIWNMGDVEDPDVPLYVKIMEESEQHRAANPPEPLPINQVDFEVLTGIPIAHVLAEADWANPIFADVEGWGERMKDEGGRMNGERGLGDV